MNLARSFGLAFCVALLLGGCAPKAGPRPLLSMTRVSAANKAGVATLWTRVQVDFKDAKKGSTPETLMDKLNEEVTFEIEGGGAKDKYIPSMVPMTCETSKLEDSTWKDRIVADVLLFPTGVGGKSVTLHATGYYQTPEDELSQVELSSPGSYGAKPKVQKIETSAGSTKGKKKISVILDKDAPAGLQVWHVAGTRVFLMEGKGARLFFHEYKDDPAVTDHRVVLESVDGWVSPPFGGEPAAPPSDEEGGASGESSEE